MLPSLDDYIHEKDLRYQLVLSCFIADKRILLYDWIRDMKGQSQRKSDIPLMTISMQTKLRTFYSFHR